MPAPALEPPASNLSSPTRTVELVLANCAYSYEIIRHAAQQVQATPSFANDPLVKSLLFSNKWVAGFLRRNDMKRRRNSATDKIRPSPAEVQAQMKLIQDFVVLHKLKNGDIINMDETGIRYGAKPLNQFVVRGAKRGSVPDADEKARFTAVMAGDAGKGSMLPTMVIIKCASAKANLKNIRVLANLHKRVGFTAAEGWDKCVWTRELALKAKTTHTNGGGKKIVKGELFKQEYSRPYLYHKQSGTVVTAQVKAWMDSVGMAMWADLVAGPWAKQKRDAGGSEHTLVVWDNCGPHSPQSVIDVYREHGITAMCLPPNMTDLLQPMDLVVNAVLKSAIRQARGKSVYDAFQLYRADTEGVLADGGPHTEFRPPKPTLYDGLRTFMATLIRLTTPKFQSSLCACFVAVGLASGPGPFPVYRAHEHTYVEVKMEKLQKAKVGAVVGVAPAVPGVGPQADAGSATRHVEAGAEQEHDDEHADDLGDADAIARWVAGTVLHTEHSDSDSDSDHEEEHAGGQDEEE